MALRNVTITLEEEVARWARVRAAETNTSVSHLVGEMVKQHMRQSDTYKVAMKRYRSRKAFIRSRGAYATRDQLHDRADLR